MEVFMLYFFITLNKVHLINCGFFDTDMKWYFSFDQSENRFLQSDLKDLQI